MWDVELRNVARRFLRKTDKLLAGRITEKLEDLRINPFSSDAKRVIGTPEKLFRVRVGDYRILYEVDHTRNVIEIVKIGHRSHVYD